VSSPLEGFRAHAEREDVSGSGAYAKSPSGERTMFSAYSSPDVRRGAACDRSTNLSDAALLALRNARDATEPGMYRDSRTTVAKLAMRCPP
jgi:hypothetical protein